MPQLFDVPGWTVPTPPASALKADKAGKKRKRPTSGGSDTGSKLFDTQINIEKVLEKLKESTMPRRDGPKEGKESKASSSDSKADKKKQKKKEKEKTKKDGKVGKKHEQARPQLTREISGPRPLQPKSKTTQKDSPRQSIDSTSTARPAKRVKTTHAAGAAAEDPLRNTKKKSVARAAAGGDDNDNLTPLQKSMKQSLDGAKFRMINESLYKSDSQSALQMMREDPTIYAEYHTGFRHQVQSWPTNPVEQYVSKLSEYPPRTVIADLGCGDAALARGLVPKGMTVLSFDLVSDGKYVVEADACKGIPLPGSEPEESGSSMGEGGVVGVVVFSLSLMSTNWPTSIREAWRILKGGGELQIAEVASRFTSVKEFEKLVSSIGFKLEDKDDSNSHFTLFEFKKVARKPFNEKDWSKILDKSPVLKPCEYKRR